MARHDTINQTGAFYMDRHETKEVHLSVPLEAITNKSDISDFDWIVLTVQYVRNGRPARKTLRFSTTELRDDYGSGYGEMKF